MRDIEFFPTYREYMDNLWNNVFVEDWVQDSEFYRNLIEFVANTRTPLFYTISDPSEHFAFSGAYCFETRRQRYPNKTREILFWLHDFTHILFPYSHDLFRVSEEKFLEQFRYQEWLASTETEIFAYYRVPELRERVFSNEKLYYDVLRDRGWRFNPAMHPKRKSPYYDGQTKPDATDFYYHRRQLVLDDWYGEFELGDYPEILVFFQKWRTLTPKWVSDRYRSMAGVRMPKGVEFALRWLRRETYEKFIESYLDEEAFNPEAQQDRYEQNVLRNLQMAYAILRWPDPPLKFRHCGDAINELEGAVFFK